MAIKIIRRTMQPTASLDTYHPLLARIFSARGVVAVEEMEHALKQLTPPQQLTDIDKAATRLADAITANQRILIVGDFDADGATSTALAVAALRAFGAQQVDFLVPNRFEYGYGLSPAIVDVAQTKQPDLIITVDNGIASIEGVARANEFGIDVIVTDHHLPGNELPAAFAIVNPNQRGDAFPSKSLAGVGVIFYTMLALRATLQARGHFAEGAMPAMNQFLDLVALGTVADLVPLDQTNRILVAQGLRRMAAGRARAGIKALLSVAKRDPAQVSTVDLAFFVGPRLNAVGRMDDMTHGIRCLLAESEQEARLLAESLQQFNDQRREVEAEMQQQAQRQLEKLLPEIKKTFAVTVYQPDWHQGVVGLIASRIKEKIHRPTIAFTHINDTQLKGSGRSIAGVHLRDVLDRIATKHPDLLSKFGGHAMAAGLTIEAKDYPRFSQLFCDEVEALLNGNMPDHEVLSDGELLLDQLNLKTAQLLQHAAPWGQAFPEPRFDGEFELLEQRIVGESHLKLKVRLPGGDKVFDAIQFRTDLDSWPNHRCDRARLVYKLDVNDYMGMQRLQLLVDHLIAL